MPPVADDGKYAKMAKNTPETEMPLDPLTVRRDPLARLSPAVVAHLIPAAFVAYGGALANGFLLDDHWAITDNTLLRDPARLPDLLRTPTWTHITGRSSPSPSSWTIASGGSTPSATT